MRKRILDLFYRALVVTIVFFLGITTRRSWINRHILDGFQREGQNFILGVWHGSIVYFIFPLRVYRLTVMASKSRDGTNIAKVAQVFGVKTAWGSTSRGAMGGIREMYRVLRSGKNVTIMPDGPRGPRYVLQSGVINLAQRNNVPIVPINFSGPRIFEFSSWDRMKLPKPFSRVTILVGDPIWIDPKDKDEEAIRLRVERAMRKNLLEVDQMVGGTLVEREPLLAELAQKP